MPAVMRAHRYRETFAALLAHVRVDPLALLVQLVEEPLQQLLSRHLSALLSKWRGELRFNKKGLKL